MYKLILNITLSIIPINLLAEQPKDWQLGFQKAASGHMEDLVWFHDYMLLPIITAITAFVLFLVIYACLDIEQLEILLHLKLVTTLLLK